MSRWWDPRSLLAQPHLYRLFSNIVNPPERKRRFVDQELRIQEGDRILDIGCGPAVLLDYFPPVHYIGFDAEARYIEQAKAQYGERGKFHRALVTEANLPDPGSYDLVLAIGVLHHLDDEEAVSLFQLAHQALKPGGRLVTVDGTFVEGQGAIARWIISRDRGEYVRSPEAYQALAARVFSDPSNIVREDLNRIPYTHCLLDCAKA